MLDKSVHEQNQEDAMLTYEGIIIENPDLAQDLRKDPRGGSATFPNDSPTTIERIPDGLTDGVTPEIYNAYRRGRDSACVDIVFVTTGFGVPPKVLLSLRKPGVCYGEKWWMYRGAIKSYMPISQFIESRAESECGIRALPRALVGVYRTMSDDYIGSTLQPCYATVVPEDSVREKKRIDSGHGDVRLFTLKELENIPLKNRHWYPTRVARHVLSAMV